MIERSVHGSAAILRLSHGKASAFDLELARALAEALQAEASTGERALVLTGTGSIFSAGVDLVRLLRGGADYVREFLPALDACLARLYHFPKPAVAAVNGHAIAGGCILALACDHRVLARGKAGFGAPELQVGVPFPPVALAIARAGVPQRAQHETLTLGHVWSAEQAAAVGLVHELADPQALLPRALAAAERLAAVPRASFELHKASLRPALGDTSAALRRAVEVWCAPETLAAVGAYVERTLGK